MFDLLDLVAWTLIVAGAAMLLFVPFVWVCFIAPERKERIAAEARAEALEAARQRLKEERDEARNVRALVWSCATRDAEVAKQTIGELKARVEFLEGRTPIVPPPARDAEPTLVSAT